MFTFLQSTTTVTVWAIIGLVMAGAAIGTLAGSVMRSRFSWLDHLYFVLGYFAISFFLGQNPSDQSIGPLEIHFFPYFVVLLLSGVIPYVGMRFQFRQTPRIFFPFLERQLAAIPWVVLILLADTFFSCLSLIHFIHSPMAFNRSPFYWRYFWWELELAIVPALGLYALSYGDLIFRVFAVPYLFIKGGMFLVFLISLSKETILEGVAFSFILYFVLDVKSFWTRCFENGIESVDRAQTLNVREVEIFTAAIPQMERRTLKTVMCPNCGHAVNISEKHPGAISIPAEKCLYCGKELLND